ncbi:MAG: acyl-CoA dehydrogenase family protein [Pseudomonadales bacterium]|jgi:alkylation response protein AidB-like acyl-CoA dehydrogenase|nr:acyl-CoA dehydrogenase family protein [Pseudomonadales bacterium]MDP7357005.1 acyl-CoA dehydrogenase family protein [Pseudomonadales bacterium]MDP7596059.1 acyl-CoA dehydrogenase family protein [Pseudomonadales bacterium]HJN50548.1 acyl-CoA dehydrogenase family protein [Pseudomonadales bacterium]|tara:strand:- start:4231 stop:5382 length:1152 start_codon:yes stop_codon:yes gene_type:complete
MDYEWDDDILAFQKELRTFCEEFSTDLRAAEDQAGRDLVFKKVHGEMERRGWLRIAWPEEYGGGGKSPFYQFVMVQEFSYAGIPYGGLSVGSIAPALLNHGTDEQKQKFLPGILDGDITFAIGYSEPNAGTDLAALQTRAVKDGDEWVINGQKIWTSEAHVSTHLWLAARTDPTAAKHRGISMFILSMDTPGMTVRPLYTMSGVRTNEVFFEDVRIPADSLIGEQDKGWYTVANALDFERVSLAPTGQLARQFDRTLEYLKEERTEQIADKGTRQRLAELKIDLHVLRALNIVNASIIANRETPTMEASMTKIWSSELRYRLSSMNMDLLGRYGGLRSDDEGLTPVDGQNEQTYRGSPILRFGGGTNEVQRNIIAHRGLGLPR